MGHTDTFNMSAVSGSVPTPTLFAFTSASCLCPLGGGAGGGEGGGASSRRLKIATRRLNTDFRAADGAGCAACPAVDARQSPVRVPAGGDGQGLTDSQAGPGGAGLM